MLLPSSKLLLPNLFALPELQGLVLGPSSSFQERQEADDLLFVGGERRNELVGVTKPSGQAARPSLEKMG